MDNKLCAFCGKKDNIEKMFDQAGMNDGFEQWVHKSCYENLKDKTNQ